MGFVPLTGAAELRETGPGERPRDAVVAFTAADGGRRVELPVRAALPVLTKAHARDDVHPSVGLLAGAALLALRLVAAGRLVPDPVGDGWRIAPLPAEDDDRVTRLALARSHDGVAPDRAEAVVRRVLDAVADTMPRTTSRPPRSRPAATASTAASSAGAAPGDFAERLAARLERLRASGGAAGPGHRSRPGPDLDDRPQLVRLTLRVEADEEDLSAGSLRLALQVHDEQDPLHLCDAAALWADPDDSGGRAARAARAGTASVHGRARTPRSRCAPPPRRGRCWTGCSTGRSPRT